MKTFKKVITILAIFIALCIVVTTVAYVYLPEEKKAMFWSGTYQ